MKTGAARSSGSSPRPTGGITVPAGRSVAALGADLAVGDVVQGRVLDDLGGGRVLLELGGQEIDAESELPLQIGRGYDFRVAALTPRIVLSAGVPSVSSPLPVALAGGQLGPGGTTLGGALRAALSSLLVPTDTDAVGDGVLPEAAAWLRGTSVPTAQELAALHRWLGHDQEVRVARLAVPGAGRDAGGGLERSSERAALQSTLKAMALAARASDGNEERPNAAGARPLLEVLRQMLVENCQRAADRSPLVLPLPVGSRAGLREAFLFAQLGDALERPPGEALAAADDRCLSIVLLLEWEHLGTVRVDLGVRGDEVTILFLAERTDSFDAMRRAAGRLEAIFAADGLRTSSLVFRRAGRQGIPVGDLMPPPNDPDARLDIHA